MTGYTTRTDHGLTYVLDSTGTRVYTTASLTEATRLATALNQPRHTRRHRQPRLSIGLMSGVLTLLSLHQSHPDAHRAVSPAHA